MDTAVHLGYLATSRPDERRYGLPLPQERRRMSGGFVSRKSPGPYLTGRNGQRAPVTTPARARLLIADDHKLFAEVLRIALQRAGWSDVTVTTTLQETLELLRVRRPHLVLMDTGLL